MATEAVWYGKKNYRSCIEKTRRTTAVIWKGPEVLQKIVWKVTTEAVW